MGSHDGSTINGSLLSFVLYTTYVIPEGLCTVRMALKTPSTAATPSRPLCEKSTFASTLRRRRQRQRRRRHERRNLTRPARAKKTQTSLTVSAWTVSPRRKRRLLFSSPAYGSSIQVREAETRLRLETHKRNGITRCCSPGG